MAPAGVKIIDRARRLRRSSSLRARGRNFARRVAEPTPPCDERLGVGQEGEVRVGVLVRDDAIFQVHVSQAVQEGRDRFLVFMQALVTVHPLLVLLVIAVREGEQMGEFT